MIFLRVVFFLMASSSSVSAIFSRTQMMWKRKLATGSILTPGRSLHDTKKIIVKLFFHVFDVYSPLTWSNDTSIPGRTDICTYNYSLTYKQYATYLYLMAPEYARISSLFSGSDQFTSRRWTLFESYKYLLPPHTYATLA